MTTTIQAQSSLLDSIQQQWSQRNVVAEDLEDLIKLTNKVGEKNLENALDLASYGQEISQSLGNKSMLAKFHIETGNVLQMRSKYDEAIAEYEQAIAYYKSVSDNKNIAHGLDRKGFVLSNKGSFLEAINLYMEVLRIQEQLKDKAGIANAYTSLSGVLYYLERYEESIEYGEKAIELYKKTDDKSGLIKAYNETAMSYLGTHSGQNEKALEYINQAISVCKNMESHPLEIGSLHNGKGNVLKYMERYKEALEAYEVSLNIAEELNHQGGISATVSNISDVYMNMEQYEKALPHQERAYKIIEENGWNQNLGETLGHLSKIHKGMGDYEHAHLYLEKLLVLRDTIFTKDKENIAQELTTKYETEKKEEQLAQNEREQNLLYAILGLVLFGLGLLTWAYIQKQKSNKILSELNKQKEFLIKEVHHRVKNNLQVISSLLNFQSRSIRDKNIKAALLDSQSRVRSMSLIHQKLYRGQHLAAIEMKNYLGNLAESLIDAYSDEDIVDVELDMGDIELDVDYAIPLGLIANELVTNSLKYAFPNEREGTIKIQLQQEDDNLLFSVADDGVGKSATKVQDVDGGFGSELIEMLSLQLKGNLVQSVEQGFQTQVKFPYAKRA